MYVWTSKEEAAMRIYFASRVAAALILLAASPASAAETVGEDKLRLRAGAVLLQGRDIYQERCASCHGQRGRGGAAAPVDFSDPAALVRLDVSAIAGSLSKEHAARVTPALSALETDAVAAYLREHLMLPAPAVDASTGRAIYAQTCSVCHGDRGDSASWAKNSLNPAPADFTSHGRNQLSRAKMIESVTFGSPGTAMVSFATQLNREQIAATVDYIRETFMVETASAGAGHAAGHDHGHDDHSDERARGHGASTAGYPSGVDGDPVWGKAFFNANCAECHGTKGDGEGPRAYFMIRKPMDLTSPLAKSRFDRPELFKAIAKGVRGAPMPAWDTVLSEKQISNVAEYVYRKMLHPDEFEAGNDPALIWRKQDDQAHQGLKKKN
jgi:mono/diheme cytochrome c family protein